eukprot:gene3660-13735_t
MTENRLDKVLVWFRRDLRVSDNPALVAALGSARTVIPYFLWAPEEEGQFMPGRCSRWWSKQSLLDLQRELEALGSRLVIARSNDRCKGLLQTIEAEGISAVFFNHLYDPISLVSDHQIKQKLVQKGVECHSFNGDLLYEPWEITDPQGQPFICFNELWERVLAMPYAPPAPLPAPKTMPPVPTEVSSLAVNDIAWFMSPEQEASSDQLRFKWKPGVAGAMKKLESFLNKRLPDFDHVRAKVGRVSTSQLSPWIHVGTLSVRYIFYRIGYREYSRYLSVHFPFIHERSLLAHLRTLPIHLNQNLYK